MVSFLTAEGAETRRSALNAVAVADDNGDGKLSLAELAAHAADFGGGLEAFAVHAEAVRGGGGVEPDPA